MGRRVITPTAHGYCRDPAGQEAIRLAWTGRAPPLGRVYVERDEGSAPLANRPEGCKLLAFLRPGDFVVCRSAREMFKGPADFARCVNGWEARGVSLVLLDDGLDTSTPAGKLALRVAASLVEVAREAKATAGREARRADRRANRRAKDPARRELGRLALSLISAGYTPAQVAEHLASQGVVGEDGLPIPARRLARWAAAERELARRENCGHNSGNSP